MYAQLIYAFFSWYIGRIIRTDFEGFSHNAVPLNDKSILLLANHFSWWDGFLMFQLNKLYLNKKFHVMVSEENYKRVGFLKYLGAFPVKKNSRQVIESLDYAGKLLNDRNNLLLVFPQGKLHSNHIHEISFEKGLLNIINSSHKDFQCLFAASFIDYFEKRKPSVNCYLKLWEEEEPVSLEVLKSAYNKHYQTSRHRQCRIII